MIIGRQALEILMDMRATSEVLCPRCEAQPGQRCKTISGKTTDTHTPRWRPLYVAWTDGYANGLAVRDSGKA